MQENKRKIKLQKLGTIALLCLFVVAFVGSIFCAMILPFVNLAPEVASAGYIPSDSSNTQYTFYGFNQDFSTDNMGLYYNLSYDCTDSTYDVFNNMIAWRGDCKEWINASGVKFRVSVFGYLYGYLYDVKTSGTASSSTLTSYQKISCPFGLLSRYDSSGQLLWHTIGLLIYDMNSTDNMPLAFIPFIYTRYREILSNSADMRVAFNYTIKYEGSYTIAPSSLAHFNTIYNYPVLSYQVGTGTSRPWYFAFSGYCLKSSSIPTDFPNYMSTYDVAPSGLTDASYNEVINFLNNCMSFGYRVSVTDSSGDFYNSGYNNGYQDAKEGFEEEKTGIYNSGFEQGKIAGYNDGYNAGKDVSSNYTFLGLIGAVFDAPIEAFKGLFNFEILGTNMQGFVLALLTLSVIIVIIKIALGGK